MINEKYHGWSNEKIQWENVFAAATHFKNIGTNVESYQNSSFWWWSLKVCCIYLHWKAIVWFKFLLRDWRGLAELIGIDMLAIQNFESQSDPFKALFHHSLKNLAVLEVITIFEKMDRYDIIDDTQALFGK